MTKAKNTKKSATKNASKNVQKPAEDKFELPTGLEPLATEMPEEEKQKLLDEYVAREREKADKRIEQRKEAFLKKLEEKGVRNREILARKVMITKIREEIKQKREAVKALQQEIKDIRPSRRRVKKEQKAAANA